MARFLLFFLATLAMGSAWQGQMKFPSSLAAMAHVSPLMDSPRSSRMMMINMAAGRQIKKNQSLHPANFLLRSSSWSSGSRSSNAPPSAIATSKRTTTIRYLLQRRGGGGDAGAALTIFSQLLGYVIIAGSMLFKVPQAARIFRKKSAEGISLSFYSLETIGIAMSLAFSIRRAFPFSTYGEAFFILIQNVMILVGISMYGDDLKPSVLALLLVLLGSAFAYAVSPLAPIGWLDLAQSISIPLLNISRIPQLMLNYKRKSTGELAPSTLVLAAVGNLIRIFTTLVQVKNKLFLLSTSVAMLFNGALVLQLVLYRNNSPPAPEDKTA